MPVGTGEPRGLLALALEKRIPLLKTDDERYVLAVIVARGPIRHDEVRDVDRILILTGYVGVR